MIEQQNLAQQVIGGCRVEKLLGRGGMGCVYLAHHLNLDIPVALKVLSKELAGTQGLVERFILEARAAARLDSPHIVRVLQVGEEQGMYYIQMEYVEGESLAQKVQREAPLPVTSALPDLYQMISGLATAHEAGIIHRDIKPENIMISTKGVLKIADFGLAKSLQSSADLTQSGQILGTPHYIPPEQCEGGNCDVRGDIYSMGVTFYYMITGQLPFKGETPIAIVVARLHSDPLAPCSICPGIPKQLQAMTLKMMARAPQCRYQSAYELLQEIEASMEQFGIFPYTLSSRYSRGIPVSAQNLPPTPTASTQANSVPTLIQDHRPANARLVCNTMNPETPSWSQNSGLGETTGRRKVVPELTIQKNKHRDTRHRMMPPEMAATVIREDVAAASRANTSFHGSTALQGKNRNRYKKLLLELACACLLLVVIFILFKWFAQENSEKLGQSQIAIIPRQTKQDENSRYEEGLSQDSRNPDYRNKRSPDYQDKRSPNYQDKRTPPRREDRGNPQDREKTIERDRADEYRLKLELGMKREREAKAIIYQYLEESDFSAIANYLEDTGVDLPRLLQNDQKLAREFKEAIIRERMEISKLSAIGKKDEVKRRTKKFNCVKQFGIEFLREDPPKTNEGQQRNGEYRRDDEDYRWGRRLREWRERRRNFRHDWREDQVESERDQRKRRPFPPHSKNKEYHESPPEEEKREHNEKMRITPLSTKTFYDSRQIHGKINGKWKVKGTILRGKGKIHWQLAYPYPYELRILISADNEKKSIPFRIYIYHPIKGKYYRASGSIQGIKTVQAKVSKSGIKFNAAVKVSSKKKFNNIKSAYPGKTSLIIHSKKIIKIYSINLLPLDN